MDAWEFSSLLRDQTWQANEGIRRDKKGGRGKKHDRIQNQHCTCGTASQCPRPRGTSSFEHKEFTVRRHFFGKFSVGVQTSRDVGHEQMKPYSTLIQN